MLKKVFAFILLLSVAACNDGGNVKPEGAGGPKKIVKTSAGTSPDWIVMQKKDSKYVYFVGIGSDATVLKKVRDKAVDDAVSQLVEYIGFRVTSRIEKSVEYHDTDDASTFSESIKESIEGKGTAKVMVDIEDFYYEQYSDSSYTMYILLKLPKEWVEKERTRLQKLAQEQRAQALDLLAKAKKLKDAGEMAMALDETLSAYFISEKAVENSDLYDQSKNLMLSVLQGLSFKLDNSPKYAFLEGGSEIIEVGIYSSGSSRAVGGLLTSVDIENETALVQSKSGFNSDKKGKIYLEIGKLLKKESKKLDLLVSFSLSKMEKIQALDNNFYQEIVKVRQNTGLNVNLTVGSRDKLTPTAIVIVSILRKGKKIMKPQFRPERYEKLGGILANRGYNIVAADIPVSVLKNAKEERDLKKQVTAYLKKNYPTSKRMWYGIEVVVHAGSNMAGEDTESAQVNVTLSLIDLETAKLEKSVASFARMWGNTFQQAVLGAVRKAYKKLLGKMADL